MIHFALIYDAVREKIDKIGNIDNNIQSLIFPTKNVRSLSVESFLLDLVKAPDDIFDKITNVFSSEDKEKSIVIYKINFNKKKIIILADTLLDVKRFIKYIRNLDKQELSEVDVIDIENVVSRINSHLNHDKERIDVATDVLVTFKMDPDKVEFCTGDIITITISVENRSKIPIIITSINNLMNRYIELIDSNFKNYTISGTSLIFDDGIHLSAGEYRQIILKLIAKEKGSVELNPSLRYRDYDGMLYRPSSAGSKLMIIKRC